MLRIIDFLKRGIWSFRLSDITGVKSFLMRGLRIFILAVRGFVEDGCQLRASALTFYTSLSIVPVAAMFFGIAKGFGFESNLKEELLEKFSDSPEVVARIIEFSERMLEKTKGGLIAGVGILVLIWAVLQVLGNVESSFNFIWGVKKHRSFFRKISDYLSFVVICPILAIMASSFTVFISTRLSGISSNIAIIDAVGGPLMYFAIKLVPYIMIWLLFTVLYLFMPNTKVEIRAAFLAGVVAGTLYQLWQVFCILAQFAISRYNAIYGSFSALPLFLIWLQVSWIIVLFGAEISFAYQNVDTYEFESDSLNISHSHRKLLTLRIAHFVIRNFCASAPPLTDEQIALRLEIPIRLVRDILFSLTHTGILAETFQDDESLIAFQPGMNVDDITVHELVRRVEEKGSNHVPVLASEELDRLSACLKEAGEQFRDSASNMKLKDIV